MTFSINSDSASPVFNSALPVINFYEDDSISVINSFWYPFIDDDATLDSLLLFQISQGSRVSVSTQGDTNIFKSELNWFGSDTLQLSVTDLGDSTSSSTFIVSVNPVNDQPEIHDLPESLYFFADSSTELYLWDFISDIESPDSLLTLVFNSSPDSILLDFQNSTDQLTVSSSGFIGNVELAITVTDDSNSAISDTIQVYSIFRDINPPQFIEPLPLIKFNEDDSVFVMNSFWYPYIYDEGTADSLLTFRISQGKNISVISQRDTNLFKAGLNWFGSDTLEMSVTDLNNLITSSSFIVSVNSVNDPPEFHGLPDSLSVEYQSSYLFKIWDYVEDIETPDSLLIYSFRSSTDSILINFVDSTGQVEMSPVGYIGSTILFVHVTDDSNASIFDSVLINIQEVTGLDPDLNNLIPDVFVLKQNYPNPFNPVTTITFGLPEASNVKLEIYNILGQNILTLFEGKKTPGYHKILWDAYNYSSGIYIYRFNARGKTNSELIKKMILLK